ncbi:MAG: PE-PPE domain-containing protein [Candidatus Saccharimonadales bacterium]
MATRRIGRLMLGLLTALVVLFGGGSIASAKTYYFQGTGPTKDSSADVNMSTDRDWRAEFAPVYGERTMDQSVKDGTDRATDEIAADLSSGTPVTIEGYSLGAVTVDSVVDRLNQSGVSTSNLTVNVIADGRQPGTGALVVLRPYASQLAALGVTAQQPTDQRQTYHCIKFDGVCDMVDPVKDPMGALTRVAGYYLYHGGNDTKYTYSNKEQLTSSKVTRGNKTIVTYDAPNPINRLTGSMQASAPTTATVAPVQVATEPTYVAPAPIQEQVQQVWEQTAPIVQQVAPQVVKPITDLASQFGIALP